MKRIIILLILLIQLGMVIGQAPLAFNYQMIVRYPWGSPVPNQNVSLRFHISKQTADEQEVFRESHVARTNEFGLVSLNIGQGNLLIGSLDAIDWSAGPYFLKVESDPNGGSNYSIVTINEILQTPYSLFALHSRNGFSGLYGDLTNLPPTAQWDQNVQDDFSGDYNSLLTKPPFPVIWDPLTDNRSVWSSNETYRRLLLKIPVSQMYMKTNLKTTGQSSLHFGNLTSKPANLDEDRTDDMNMSRTQIISGVKTFSGVLSASQGIDAAGQAISNVLTPVDATDAINKSYLDQLYERVTDLEELTKYGYVYDFEGNKYLTVKIGNQEWMAENLRTRYDKNGIPLDSLVSGFQYPNGNIVHVKKYGILYNTQIGHDLCPTGWHIPTDLDWQTLELFAGMNVTDLDSVGCRGKVSSFFKPGAMSGFNLVFPGIYHMYMAYPGVREPIKFDISTSFLTEDTFGMFSYRGFSIDSDAICRSYFRPPSKTYDLYFYSARCIKD